GHRRGGSLAPGARPSGTAPDRLHERDGARYARPARDHLQPAGGRAELPRLRRAHGAQWHLLQVLQLRSDQRLLLRWGDRSRFWEAADGWRWGRPPRGTGAVRASGAGRRSGAPRGGAGSDFPLDRVTTRPIRAAT